MDAVEAPPPAADKAAPIGHLAIHGVVWSTASTLSAKVVSVLQQYVIAKFFLSKEDFGLVAMGQVVISLTSIGQNLGLSEVMARRHRTFERWAQAAMWVSVTGSLLGIALIMAILPFWERLYHFISSAVSSTPHETPHIQYLLAIWCLGLPLDAITTIFNARMRADMRFRTWAMLAWTQTVGLAVLSVVLAKMGFGAYALVIPVPSMMVVAFLLSRHYSGQRIRLDPQFHRWGALLRDARYLIPGNVFNVLLQQGDYLITGFFFEEAILGAYYFAFRMSSQTGQLLSANLAAILVPSFARLDQEKGRQIAAYERTCSVLLLLGIPLCCLQALLARPMFHLLFGAKWNAAAPLFEILSLVMGFAMPMSTAVSLLLAQGRLRLNMLLTISQAVLFVSFVLCGALCGSVEWVARFVALFYLIFGPLTVAVPVINRGTSAPRFLFRVYWFPTLAGAVSVVAAWGLTKLLHIQGDLPMMATRLAAWAAIMVLLLLALRPAAAQEVLPRATAILRRFMPRRKPA